MVNVAEHAETSARHCIHVRAGDSYRRLLERTVCLPLPPQPSRSSTSAARAGRSAERVDVAIAGRQPRPDGLYRGDPRGRATSVYVQGRENLCTQAIVRWFQKACMKMRGPRQLGVGWEINWSCPVFVAGFRSGEAGALAAIYGLHLSDVCHVVRHGFGTTGHRRAFIPGIRKEDERDDLVQEAFSRAFSSRARLSFDPSRAYEPYLLAICRHALVDWHRTTRQRRRLDGSFWEVMCLTDSSQSVVASDPQPDKVIEAYVDTLDRRLKEVFEQVVVQGRSQRETALALGLSRQNVRTLERRLRAGIKHAVNGRK